ncbi:ferritin-like domain-containing protein [Streptomyces sp. NPDC002446]
MITALALDQQGFEIPATIERLRKFLQAALEVEHLTIPVYMTGMYSLHPGTNRTAYFAIRSVLMEEMLHMTLAANLLNAVGGTPRVGRSEFVAEYPAKLPFSSGKEVPLIHLQHFSPAALRTFLRIELPRKLVPNPEPGDGWTSIGQFYDAIRQGLENLVRQHGEAQIFQGNPQHQVGPEDFYNSGGEVFPVRDLKSAKLAIRVISEQGEGIDDKIWTSDDLIFGEQRQLAHYFRFNEIYTGRSYGPHDTPGDAPSGPLLDVTWDDAYPIHGDSKVGEYVEDPKVYEHAVAFNTRYAELLSYLDKAVNGNPRGMALAIPTMLELRDRAEQLFRNPHPARPGFFASPTFELAPVHFDTVRDTVEENLRLAGLEPGEPIDLSLTS